jgi:general secretion pathway protein N
MTNLRTVLVALFALLSNAGNATDVKPVGATEPSEAYVKPVEAAAQRPTRLPEVLPTDVAPRPRPDPSVSFAERFLAAYFKPDLGKTPTAINTHNGTYASANPLAKLTLEDLSASRDRPLFSAKRRPPAPPRVEPVIAPPPPPLPPPSIALAGIIRDPDRSFAVVRTAGNKILRLRLGDNIDGWNVEAVDGVQLTLSHENRVVRFVLFKGREGPPAGGPNLAGAPPGKPNIAGTPPGKPRNAPSSPPPGFGRPSI